MPVKGERLSSRQIALVKHLAICTGKGGQAMLSREQREAAVPLWRRGLIECWIRMVPDEGHRGPFYKLSHHGRLLAQSIDAGADKYRKAA